MDEINHRFEMSPADVVFIEDLDRFNDKSPFVRLREINFLVNSSAAIAHPVRFIYALNENIFEPEDKAKFFDLIVPVIPVINSENSRDVFSSMLEGRVGAKVKEVQVAQLVETIAFYVGDMRQLKQMVNELELYRSALKGGNAGDIGKELAIVAIRCIYPHEYSLLLKGKGRIKIVLDMFPTWQRDELRALEEAYAILKRELEVLNSDVATDLIELRRIIWSRIEESASSSCVSSVTVSGQSSVAKRDFINDGAQFDSIVESVQLRLSFSGSYVGAVDVAVLMREGAPSLQQRLALRLRGMEGVKRDASRTERRIEEVRSTTLSDALCDSSFIQKVSEYCDRHELHLIPYLLRKGLFSSDYADYIGYFYPGALSASDKKVLLELRSGKLLDVDVRLDSPLAVLEKLSVNELGGGVGIISDIFEVMLRGAEKDRHINFRRIASILLGYQNNLSRLDDLFRSLSQKGFLPEMTAMVVSVDPCIVVELIADGGHCSSQDSRELLSILLATLCSPGSNADLNDKVCGFLSQVENIDVIVRNDSWKALSQWFDFPGARLVSVNRRVSREDALLGLENRAIQMNFSNLSTMAEVIPADPIDDLAYSSLGDSAPSAIIEFVNANWEEYVRSVYPGHVDPSRNELPILVKRSSDFLNLDKYIIEVMPWEIDDIKDIDPRLWRFAAELGRVGSNLANLVSVSGSLVISNDDMLYIGGKIVEGLHAAVPLEGIESLDSSLVSSVSLLLTSLPSDLERKAASLAVNFNIGLQLLESSGFVSSSFAMFLVDAGLKFSKEVFSEMLSASTAGALALASRDVEGFLEYISEHSVDSDFMARVYRSDNFSVDEKVRIFRCTDSVDLASNAELSMACAEFISGLRDRAQVKSLYEASSFVEISSHLKNEEDLVRLLVALMLVAPVKDVASIFERLEKSGFSAILKSPQKLEVSDDLSSEELMCVLRSRDIVGAIGRKPGRLFARVRKAKLALDVEGEQGSE